jgi:hypothetical protein
MNSSDSQFDYSDMGWTATPTESRSKLQTLNSLVRWIEYLEQLGAKLDEEIESEDACLTSRLSIRDVNYFRLLVDREVARFGASIERLIGGLKM